MCLCRGVLSVKPLIYKGFLVRVSPSLCVRVMEKSWKNEVLERSKFPNIRNFPITVENSIPSPSITHSICPQTLKWLTQATAPELQQADIIATLNSVRTYRWDSLTTKATERVRGFIFLNQKLRLQSSPDMCPTSRFTIIPMIHLLF